MRTITVTGRGSATAVPDSAVVRVTFVHRGYTVADALEGCDSAARDSVEVALRFTDRAHIASSHMHVAPHHDREELARGGFEARHSMGIGCPDLGAAGELVAALAAEIGDRLRIDDIALEVRDPSAAHRTAREAAYADAVAQATHLAGLAGASVGEVQALGAGRDDGDQGELEVLLRSAQVGLEPGETAIHEVVRVTFQLV